MPSSLSGWIIIFYALLVVAAQTASDTYFTRPIIPGSWKQRSRILALANAIGLFVTALVYRLLLPFNHLFLLTSRERGTMSVAVLAVILEYFLWLLPFIGVRGWIVREWAMGDEIREKQQAWWSYVLVGTLVALVLLGPLYIAMTIVQPLMTGVEEVFSD